MDVRNGVTDHSSIPTIRRGQYIKDHSLINMDLRNGGFDHSSSHISLGIGVTIHNYINRPGTFKFTPNPNHSSFPKTSIRRRLTDYLYLRNFKVNLEMSHMGKFLKLILH